MTLTSFGCSFVFGNDLADCEIVRVKHQSPSRTYSCSTWPALVAARLGYTYDCQARPGSGNLQIAERVLNHGATNPADLVTISWTWIDRFDYMYDAQHTWNPWATLRPTQDSESAKTYYKDLHSEYQDKLTTLIYVKTVIDFLLEKKQKFIMTYMDDLMFDQTWHMSPAVQMLQRSVKPYMTLFDNQTFLNWSRANGYKESKTWHPLEDAHLAAADVVIKAFDKQNTSGPVQQVLS